MSGEVAQGWHVDGGLRLASRSASRVLNFIEPLGIARGARGLGGDLRSMQGDLHGT